MGKSNYAVYSCCCHTRQLKSTLYNECNFRISLQGADKSLARPGRKQANVSVRMVWISFGALPCRGKNTWWQLASRCCWNRARPWHASELISFLVGLRTYQHPGIYRFAPVLHTSFRCIFSPQTLTEICGALKDVFLRIALTLLVVHISRAVGRVLEYCV